MKKEIQAISSDIEQFEKCSENITDYDPFYKNTFNELKGKYSHLDGFPVLMDNPLFLQVHRDVYKDYVTQIVAFLKSYVSRFDVTEETESPSKPDLTKVFIVHGHNGELKEAVARIIERQGLEAIILSEQTNCGNTIIEKFEANSNVGAAICLFTADDIGRSASETSGKDRARQNVVFETGYFIGKLSRKNIIRIAGSTVEMPSDLSGVVYTNQSDWKTEVLKELKAIGYDIDLNKL